MAAATTTAACPRTSPWAATARLSWPQAKRRDATGCGSDWGAARTGCYDRPRMMALAPPELAPPPIVARGQQWSREALSGAARRFVAALGVRLLSSADPVAMVMDNDAASVALFFALSCGGAPVVLLPPDLAPSRHALGLPRATRLVLSAGQRGADAWSEAFADVHALPEPLRGEAAGAA